MVDCISLELFSKAYEEFAHIIEQDSALYLSQLSFLGDTYSLALLPQIYKKLMPDTISLTEGHMLKPLKTATLILHLDIKKHASLAHLCNSCDACKNYSCPTRKSSTSSIPRTYGAMQIFS